MSSGIGRAAVHRRRRPRLDVDRVDPDHLEEEHRDARLLLDDDRVHGRALEPCRGQALGRHIRRHARKVDVGVLAGRAGAVVLRDVRRERLVGKVLRACERCGVGRSLELAVCVEQMPDVDHEARHRQEPDRADDDPHEHLAALALDTPPKARRRLPLTRRAPLSLPSACPT